MSPGLTKSAFHLTHKVWSSVARVHGDRRRERRLPLLPDILRGLLRLPKALLFEHVCCSTVAIWCNLLASRAGELLNSKAGRMLCWQNLWVRTELGLVRAPRDWPLQKWQSVTSIIVGFSATKTMQPGPSNFGLHKELVVTGDEDFCGVRAFIRWLSARRMAPGADVADALFLQPNGEPASVDWYRPRLKGHLRETGLPDAELYNTHSGRGGGLTTRAALGISNAELMLVGPHKSEKSLTAYVSQSVQSLATVSSHQPRMAAMGPVALLPSISRGGRLEPVATPASGASHRVEPLRRGKPAAGPRGIPVVAVCPRTLVPGRLSSTVLSTSGSAASSAPPIPVVAVSARVGGAHGRSVALQHSIADAVALLRE